MKPDFGPKPALDWLSIDQVSVDAKYQRDTGSRRSQNLIAKIVAGFRWSRFGVVLTVKFGKGWHVIDGQHRVEACRALNIPKIPAVVLPHSSVEEAAADFVAINLDRVAVTPLHLHHAMLAAGAPDAQAVERVCKAAGITICRYPVPANKMAPGQTLAVGTISRIIKQHGEAFAISIMTAVRKDAGNAPGGVNAPTMRIICGEKLAKMPPSSKGGKATRLCLKCRTPFPSSGPGNRMCTSCARVSE